MMPNLTRWLRVPGRPTDRAHPSFQSATSPTITQIRPKMSKTTWVTITP